MDTSFYAYFRDSLERFEYVERPWRGRFPEGTVVDSNAHYAARAALETGRQTARDVGKEDLRPDGELLLYLLAREFVAKPAIAVRGYPGDEIAQVLDADTRDIVRISAEIDSDSPEITAHSIVGSLGTQWADLRSASLEIWGP